MPPEGHTSITIAENIFDRFDEVYKWNKECGTLDPGICSLSSYFAEKFQEMIDEKKATHNFCSKIEFVPAKFTTTKLVIKTS